MVVEGEVEQELGVSGVVFIADINVPRFAARLHHRPHDSKSAADATTLGGGYVARVHGEGGRRRATTKGEAERGGVERRGATRGPTASCDTGSDDKGRERTRAEEEE